MEFVAKMEARFKHDTPSRFHIYLNDYSHPSEMDGFVTVYNENTPEWNRHNFSEIVARINWERKKHPPGAPVSVRGNTILGFGLPGGMNVDFLDGQFFSQPRMRPNIESQEDVLYAMNLILDILQRHPKYPTDFEFCHKLKDRLEMWAHNRNKFPQPPISSGIRNLLEGLSDTETLMVPAHFDSNNCPLLSEVISIAKYLEKSDAGHIRHSIIGYWKKSALDSMLRISKFLPIIDKAKEFIDNTMLKSQKGHISEYIAEIGDRGLVATYNYKTKKLVSCALASSPYLWKNYGYLSPYIDSIRLLLHCRPEYNNYRQGIKIAAAPSHSRTPYAFATICRQLASEPPLKLPMNECLTTEIWRRMSLICSGVCSGPCCRYQCVAHGTIKKTRRV